VAVAVDQVGEVLGHVLHQPGEAALGQAEHGEVRVPVVKLDEAPARHHVGVRQLQQRAAQRVPVRLARQVGPERIDVPGQALARFGHVVLAGRPRRIEVLAHESRQVEAGQPAPRAVGRQDLRGLDARAAIHEGLAVGEDGGALHVLEQLLVAVGGCAVVRWRRAGGGSLPVLRLRPGRGHCSS
jgi:hypothetical protein